MIDAKEKGYSAGRYLQALKRKDDIFIKNSNNEVLIPNFLNDFLFYS